MRILRLTLVLMAGLMVGCIAGKGPQFTQPGAVEEIKPAETNALTGEVTPALSFTNKALSDKIVSGLRALDTGLSAAGIPWTHTATEGLLALAGVYLGLKNRRAREQIRNQDATIDDHGLAFETARQVQETLVDNFEKLRSVALTVPGYTPDIDHKVMTAVQLAQLGAGEKVAGIIKDIVAYKTAETTAKV